MTGRRERIESALLQGLPQAADDEWLEVLDESHQHSGGPQAESHYRVLVVRAAFAGTSPVARHRMVQGLVAPEFQNGLHALAINAWTPEQWQARVAAGQERPRSPACRGGSAKAE